MALEQRPNNARTAPLKSAAGVLPITKGRLNDALFVPADALQRPK